MGDSTLQKTKQRILKAVEVDGFLVYGIRMMEIETALTQGTERKQLWIHPRAWKMRDYKRI